MLNAAQTVISEQAAPAAIREVDIWPEMNRQSSRGTGEIQRVLLHNFVGLRSAESGATILAFTSALKQEGVSHVVQSLAEGLRQHTGGKILVLAFEDLKEMAERDNRVFSDGSESGSSGLSLLLSKRLDDGGNAPASIPQNVWSTLRAKYQYVFIECPALDAGSQILSLGKQIDGTVLVVRAGFSRKTEIQQTARVLGLGQAKFLGCILNRRTYVVPRWLYKYL
jgi:hypothetical protein